MKSVSTCMIIKIYKNLKMFKPTLFKNSKNHIKTKYDELFKMDKLNTRSE